MVNIDEIEKSLSFPLWTGASVMAYLVTDGAPGFLSGLRMLLPQLLEMGLPYLSHMFLPVGKFREAPGTEDSRSMLQSGLCQINMECPILAPAVSRNFVEYVRGTGLPSDRCGLGMSVHSYT